MTRIAGERGRAIELAEQVAVVIETSVAALEHCENVCADPEVEWLVSAIRQTLALLPPKLTEAMGLLEKEPGK